MKKNTCLISTALCLVAVIAACGGDRSGPGTATTPTKAIVKLASAGTATTIYGIDVTVNLPDGVTVKSTNPPQVDADAIMVSGVTGTETYLVAVYTSATSTVPGKVRVLLADENGLATGEFCTVKADITSGAAPTSGDFSIANFTASNGNVISGLTPTFSVEFQ